MARHLLLVVTAPDPKAEVLERAKERVRSQAHQDVEILVVAPASSVSFLDWLTSDVDSASAAAAHRAQDSAEAEREAHGGTVVGTKVGDVDPLTAVEDALRTFAADEIVLVTRPNESSKLLVADATQMKLRSRFGVPVRQLIVEERSGGAETSPNGRARSRMAQRFRDAARNIARGRSPWTAFFALAGILGAVAVVAAVLIAVALAVYFTAR